MNQSQKRSRGRTGGCRTLYPPSPYPLPLNLLLSVWSRHFISILCFKFFLVFKLFKVINFILLCFELLSITLDKGSQKLKWFKIFETKKNFELQWRVSLSCVHFLPAQMMVYNTGLIPSRFYEVLLARDKEDFSSLLISSLLIIIGVSLVSFQLR